MQLVDGVNVPVELVVKLTEPVGVTGDPDVVESVTVAVHVVEAPIVTGEGAHATLVVVVRCVDASLKLPLDPACVESPEYVPVMRWWPVTVGVYDTEHVAVPAVVPAASVHIPFDGVNVPVLFVVKVTVPVGVVGEALVSVTVAVQLVGLLSATDPGEQLTVVVVACGGAGVTASRNVPELATCVGSPA